MTTNKKYTRIHSVYPLYSGLTIRASKGDNVVEAEVRSDLGDGNFYLPLAAARRDAMDKKEGTVRIAALLADGWTIEKVEEVPVTPTEPGHYTDASGRPWLRLGRGFGDQLPGVDKTWLAWDGGKFTPEVAERNFGPFKKVEA